MKMYEFLEPHVTGGHSRVTISECNIIKYMKEKIVPKHIVLSDKQIVESFCADYWAKPYVDLERKLAEAREEVKTYKYDLDTLSSIVIECVYDMSKDEAMSILKEVADHYKKLKEKGGE